jgi:hypothetical protein
MTSETMADVQREIDQLQAEIAAARKAAQERGPYRASRQHELKALRHQEAVLNIRLRDAKLREHPRPSHVADTERDKTPINAHPISGPGIVGRSGASYTFTGLSEAKP